MVWLSDLSKMRPQVRHRGERWSKKRERKGWIIFPSTLDIVRQDQTRPKSDTGERWSNFPNIPNHQTHLHHQHCCHHYVCHRNFCHHHHRNVCHHHHNNLLMNGPRMCAGEPICFVANPPSEWDQWWSSSSLSSLSALILVFSAKQANYGCMAIRFLRAGCFEWQNKNCPRRHGWDQAISTLKNNFSKKISFSGWISWAQGHNSSLKT